LIVFLDLVGFGMLITLSPFLARHFAADEFQLGLWMASYSVMQFLFAPLWGRLSDRVGRRPILLMSLLGGSISYLGLAFAPSLTWLFICRSFAGVFAANISTAHAGMADVSSKKDRASAMGLIGAAFGLGFIVGPSMGALFGYLGNKLGTEAPYGIFFPAFMAFIITFLNFVWAYFKLPETRRADSAPVHKAPSWWHFASQPFLVSYLIVVFFLANFAMPLMEVMLFPFVNDRFNWGLEQSGMGFAVVGLVMAFTQGYLVRKVMPKWGERKTSVLGMGLLALSFYLISLSHTLGLLSVAMVILAVGNGLMRPSLLAIVSLLADEKQQGIVMGASQSAACLGGFVGPVLGGWLYTSMGQPSPFFAAGCITVLGFLALIAQYKVLPDQRAAGVSA
jgi:MFS family permease